MRCCDAGLLTIGNVKYFLGAMEISELLRACVTPEIGRHITTYCLTLLYLHYMLRCRVLAKPLIFRGKLGVGEVG